MQKRPRARDIGIPFDGQPGRFNAITDVPGVEVGYCTLIDGEGDLRVGSGPVRTGVTAIHPRGKDDLSRCFASWFSLNGNGELTGTTWIEESGCLDGPILITNTHSVGIVRDAAVKWMWEKGRDSQWSLPVVGETYDGLLNDINGFHVKEAHTVKALDSAASGPIREGNVGGGTGMTLFEFKGGTGTASRLVDIGETYSVGVLVQANFGERKDLRVAGLPVGRQLPDKMPIIHEGTRVGEPGEGSIIAVVATDAPLIPTQLHALCKRVSMGLARNGSVAAHSSGDIFAAFSTANRIPDKSERVGPISVLASELLTPLFGAVAAATEEAIINALVAAETMQGQNGNTAFSVPIEQLQGLLRSHNRLVEDDLPQKR